MEERLRQKHQHQLRIFTDLQEVSGVLSDETLSMSRDSYIVFKLAGVDEIYVAPAVANMGATVHADGQQIELGFKNPSNIRRA